MLPTIAMLAPTHIAFGLLAAGLLSLASGSRLGPEAFALAALGALLPDVDTTTSTAGRLLYPLAEYIERRFGHRSITHSLVGLTIAALLSYFGLRIAHFGFSHSPFRIPQLLLSSAEGSAILWWSAFVIGYASHLLADSMTKAGIPLFWPHLNYQAVLPGNEAYRLRTGSTGEFVLLALLIPLTALTVPLSQLSLTTALHYLIRDVNSAANDYQVWAGQHLVWVELEGRHNLSQKPVRGIFETIDTAGQTAIILRDSQGNIYAAGNSRDDQIYVHRIRAMRGIPIRTEIQEVRMADQLLGDLFGYLAIPPSSHPAIETWIQGWFVTPQRPLLIDDVGEYNRSKRAQSVAGEHLYEIRYFTPEDLAPLQNIYVTRAHFIVRIIYPVEESAKGSGRK